ncbi:MAG: tetratricopeptide repeat protein [Tepidisphaeraceae bacterium]
MTIEQTIDAAAQLHRAGRFAEAERQYRQVLALQPDNADALHLLGVLCSQQGREDVAADLIRRAIARDPGQPIYHGNLGLALSRLGRLDEAIRCFEKALALGSRDPNVLNNYADSLRKAGKPDRALPIFHQAIAIDPRLAEAHNNLGIALADLGRIDEAVASYRQAIRLNPRFAEARNNLGNALLKKRLFDEAIVEFEQALAARPDYPEAMMNLGAALKARNQDDRAIDLFRRALRLRPDFFEALLNYGQALCDSRHFDDAIAAFRKAIALRPDDPAAHFHLSGVLLLTGNFSDGWREYEWRLLKPDFGIAKTRFPQPRWTGQDLAGKRIFLHAEQGAGDIIQFSRLAALLSQRGAQTILACPPTLLRLMRSLDGVSHLITNTQLAPDFDYHCYLLSLPLLLGLNLQTIPANVPYLRAQPELAEHWRSRLMPLGNRKKVGLVWAGNPNHSNDHNRSIPPSAFAPLAEISGVSFISLQKNDAPNPLPPPGFELIDHTAEIFDYADTAGLIANLDLVIAADTSVAHLAGALAKPVWTLLPFHPDLRWMLDRSDSPWYPTMRLFRQPRPGDWQTPIRQIADALGDFVK